MALYVVNLKAGASIYVVAANESNAVYKAYNKAVANIGTVPSNEAFEKWKVGIESIKALYTIEVDENRFNVF